MKRFYPEHANHKEKMDSLASKLFGHRLKDRQSISEYTIEFLQVMLASKEMDGQRTERYFPTYDGMYPIVYHPKTGVGIKRFVFFPYSKPEGKADVDKEAYQACVEEISKKIKSGNGAVSSAEITRTIQSLMVGFSAVHQNRAWFDQNLLPVCKEVILPEGMGVKSMRSKVHYATGNAAVDNDFSYDRYTYMCRGGEVYYLHLLSGAMAAGGTMRDSMEAGFARLIENGFPQLGKLFSFVKNTWESHLGVTDKKDVAKTLVGIPAEASGCSVLAASEIDTLLKNNIHPLEKINILSDGIVLQLMRMMYFIVGQNMPGANVSWVMDMSSERPSDEIRKIATASFVRNEESVTDYIYAGYEAYKDDLNQKKSPEAHYKDTASDSYMLYRRLGKQLGIIVPIAGAGMRFTMSERIVKFLVLSMIPPKGKVTLDSFLSMLGTHYNIIIDRTEYINAVALGQQEALGNYECFDKNKKAFVAMLKSCGFLRDVSDATAIVENPYDEEKGEGDA